ncbi:MAG: hypothetical protein M3O71_03930 [Bacteroidota bacterium]|nr:hypothetical protein [Bacteroidota bacterium]
MKRLYSYVGLYGFVLGAPIFSLGIIILVCIFAIGGIWIACIPVVPIMLYWLFTFRRWKKVYYERGSIYIYNLFSNTPTIVHKEDIGGIDKLMFYDPRFYRIIFYNENKDAEFVYFQRNWLLDDFGDIVDKLIINGHT